MPLLLLGVVTLALSAQAHADEEKARLGRKVWSAFECSTFAEMSGDTKEHERLFLLGIHAGRDFLKAVRNKEFTKEEGEANVPVGILLLLGGPSDDFMLGRIFESVANEAYDEVVKDDEFGIELDVTKWRTDEGLKKLFAGNAFRASNCDLIR